MKDHKYTLQSFFFLYIDEPFEWTKIGPGPDDVYFKSQNPYNYTQAKEYCNRQGDMKSTGVGTHASQLWKFDNTTKKLINKFGRWTSDPNVTWNIIDKPRNMVSIQKITEEKDSKFPPDDDKSTTNIPKKKGIVKTVKDTVKKGVKKIKSLFVGVLGGEGIGGNNVGVLPDGKKQLWKKTVEPSGYFTLEDDTEADKFLTADNGGLQLRGMFILFTQPVKKND